MIPPLSAIDWRKSARMVPSRYPPIGVFDRVARAQDLEAVFAIEALTNDRVRDELGEICLVPEEDRIAGAGTTPIMAAFTHPNRDGSRFSDGSFGVYYAGDSLATAIAESRFHRERFLAYSAEPPIRLEMRCYYARVRGELHDLRKAQGSNPQWFDPDPRRYGAGQVLGLELKSRGSNGLVYHSVRRPEGECVGIFRPRLVSPVTQGPHFEYLWDGRSIVEVLQIQRYADPGAAKRKP
jgi:hypothetical protein